MAKGCTIFWFALFGLGAQPTSGFPGQIIGVVKGADGSTIAGARVSFRPVASARYVGSPSKVLPDVSATTSPTGAFSLPDLAGGTYSVCVVVPKGGWLNPCVWGGAPLTEIVVAGRLSSPTLTLARGAIIPVRVDDPLQLTAQSQGATGALIVLGLQNDGHGFEPGVVKGRDAAGFDYQATIPFDRQIQLVVASSFFKLAYAGAPVAATGFTIPISVPSGQAAATIHVGVSGTR